MHYPKNAAEAILDTVQMHIQNFEKYLKTIKSGINNNVNEWIDLDECVRHYWVQEFTKNPDAEFYTSVYFTWVKDDVIKLGPVWDFDLAFGNHSNDKINVVENWHLRKYWYNFLFNDDVYRKKSVEFWRSNYNLFAGVLDSINVCEKKISNAVLNNFKRWDILGKNELYNGNVALLKEWVKLRIHWIDSQFKE